MSENRDSDPIIYGIEHSAVSQEELQLQRDLAKAHKCNTEALKKIAAKPLKVRRVSPAEIKWTRDSLGAYSAMVRGHFYEIYQTRRSLLWTIVIDDEPRYSETTLRKAKDLVEGLVDGWRI